MRIKAKQATNSAGTIKQPSGQYMKTGRVTLKELFSVHLPDSTLTDEIGDGQGQQNLGKCGSTTNRGD
jgi:hypothetical protein